jgi:hypothetical protein
MAQLSRNILIPPRLVVYNSKIYYISGYGKTEDGKYGRSGWEINFSGDDSGETGEEEGGINEAAA